MSETPHPHPEPRRRGTPIWLWGAIVALLGMVVVMQRPAAPNAEEQRKQATGETVSPPDNAGLVMVGKLGLAMKRFAGPSDGTGDMLLGISDSLVGWEASTPLAGPISPQNPPKPRTTPFPAADRIRAAIVAGELSGPKALADRLELVETDASLAGDSPLREDIRTLRALYQTEAAAGPAGSAPAPEQAAIDGLRDRHAWFADLALSKPDDARSIRAAAADQGSLMMVVILLGTFGAGLALLTGFVLLIIAMASLNKLRPRFVAPRAEGVDDSGRAPPRWVWLETVGVFIAGFLGLKLAGMGLEYALGGGSWLVWFSLLGQWALLATIFWPLARGMSLARWRSESGWHRGAGVFKEIGAGLAAYLAALPIYFGVALLVVLATFAIGRVLGGEAPVPEGNRITEIVGAGGPGVLVMVFLLATVWAPVVEESIFRGALYRHLRRRWAVVVAAGVSALVFAVMHGYVIQGLVMVGTLGFAFAIMREWRGSIIASVTAHAIHNGVVLTLLTTILTLARP